MGPRGERVACRQRAEPPSRLVARPRGDCDVSVPKRTRSIRAVGGTITTIRSEAQQTPLVSDVHVNGRRRRRHLGADLWRAAHCLGRSRARRRAAAARHRSPRSQSPTAPPGKPGSKLSASAWRRSRACWRSAAARRCVEAKGAGVKISTAARCAASLTDLRRKMAAARAAMPRRGDSDRTARASRVRD